jgi:transposase InsO family protein
MMLDDVVVSVSPATTYRVLKTAGRLDRRVYGPNRKGTGFEQPLGPHQHWHVDISHVNIAGMFYYLCSVLDGYSRFIAHWDFRPSMTEADIELILQRALEKFPDARPRVISDNGPQFVAKDFKRFIDITGMTHVRTAPYYPQSNGKIERSTEPSTRTPSEPSRPTASAASSPSASTITATPASTAPSAT